MYPSTQNRKAQGMSRSATISNLLIKDFRLKHPRLIVTGAETETSSNGSKIKKDQITVTSQYSKRRVWSEQNVQQGRRGRPIF
jgi:hypothetical protein